MEFKNLIDLDKGDLYEEGERLYIEKRDELIAKRHELGIGKTEARGMAREFVFMHCARRTADALLDAAERIGVKAADIEQLRKVAARVAND